MSGTLFYPWNLEQDQLTPLCSSAARQEPGMPKWLAHRPLQGLSAAGPASVPALKGATFQPSAL